MDDMKEAKRKLRALHMSIMAAIGEYQYRHNAKPARISMTAETLHMLQALHYTNYMPDGTHYCGIPVDIASGEGIRINLVEPEIQLLAETPDPADIFCWPPKTEEDNHGET